MKIFMKKAKSIFLAFALVAACISFEMETFAATTIQTKIASKPTTATATKKWSITDGPGRTQGACKVGNYLYVGYRKVGNDNIGKGIVKYNFSTGEVVKTSDTDYGHTNDMTYNSKIGKLVVCHNAPIANQISIVNPDTLVQEQVYYISKDIYGIEYIEATDTYVVGRTGDEALVFLNSDFVPVNYDATKYAQASTIGGSNVSNYLPQGINCDGTYIYATWYPSTDSIASGYNYIVVYDMSGNQVTQIKTNLSNKSYEVECMAITDGSLYLILGGKGSNPNTGTYLYEIPAANLK